MAHCVILGYIGGAVLTRILQHPDRPRLDITALVRSPEKAEKLEKLDITPVLGSLQDTGRLEDLASKADIVVACVRLVSLAGCGLAWLTQMAGGCG